MTVSLKQVIKDKSRQLGFILAGVASCEPPTHYAIFADWLKQGNHAGMDYLAGEHSRARRADPKQILPECKSILVLALPYQPVTFNPSARSGQRLQPSTFHIASYALGDDYHEVIPPRLQQIVEFIEEQIGPPIPNRYYTDTGHLLERELAVRAGLGWIGKNSMLIHPRFGSTFLLAEILLGVELEPDDEPITDHCGTCTRCIDACPTQAILPNRAIDSRRCISYLTIENKSDIPEELRPQLGNWVFGCDICQMVCPWNRFSAPADSALEPQPALRAHSSDMTLSPIEFNQRFKRNPIKRAKRRGYLRNLSVALGNNGGTDDLPLLEGADEPLVREHAQWAIRKIKSRQ